MLRSKALVILTRQISHICPYKGHDVALALCYMKSQDVAERDLCYGCDHIDKLKEKYGLRTFKRQLVFSTCKHCCDAVSLHEKEAPHKGTRDTRCPGFEPEDDRGRVYVPTNAACTEWMLVDVATGERFPYVDHRTKWDAPLNALRFRIPLLGAPGTVPSDSRDELRVEAATFASRKRDQAAMAALKSKQKTKKKP